MSPPNILKLFCMNNFVLKLLSSKSLASTMQYLYHLSEKTLPPTGMNLRGYLSGPLGGGICLLKWKWAKVRRANISFARNQNRITAPTIFKMRF